MTDDEELEAVIEEQWQLMSEDEQRSVLHLGKEAWVEGFKQGLNLARAGFEAFGGVLTDLPEE